MVCPKYFAFYVTSGVTGYNPVYYIIMCNCNVGSNLLHPVFVTL